MNRAEWRKLDPTRVAGYHIAIAEENSIVAGVRLQVEMAGGRRYLLNDVLYDSVPIAAMALPDVLDQLISDDDDEGECDD